MPPYDVFLIGLHDCTYMYGMCLEINVRYQLCTLIWSRISICYFGVGVMFVEAGKLPILGSARSNWVWTIENIHTCTCTCVHQHLDSSFKVISTIPIKRWTFIPMRIQWAPIGKPCGDNRYTFSTSMAHWVIGTILSWLGDTCILIGMLFSHWVCIKLSRMGELCFLSLN